MQDGPWFKNLPSVTTDPLEDLQAPIVQGVEALAELAGAIALIAGIARLLNKTLFPRSSN